MRKNIQEYQNKKGITLEYAEFNYPASKINWKNFESIMFPRYPD